MLSCFDHDKSVVGVQNGGKDLELFVTKSGHITDGTKRENHTKAVSRTTHTSPSDIVSDVGAQEA